MSILLFVIANVVFTLHQRKITKKVEKPTTPSTNGEEEEEMVSYLRNQEDA